LTLIFILEYYGLIRLSFK